MYTRDLIVDECQKMALVIAKLLGIRSAGTTAEFEQEFNNVLQSEYNIELEELLTLTEEEFINKINTAEYSSEKLNALSQMLYVFAEPLNKMMKHSFCLKKY